MLLLTEERTTYVEYLPLLITHYGAAAKGGRRHMFHALPRLITIYCEAGSDCFQVESMGVSTGTGGAQAKMFKILRDKLLEKVDDVRTVGSLKMETIN